MHKKDQAAGLHSTPRRRASANRRTPLLGASITNTPAHWDGEALERMGTAGGSLRGRLKLVLRYMHCMQPPKVTPQICSRLPSRHRGKNCSAPGWACATISCLVDGVRPGVAPQLWPRIPDKTNSQYFCVNKGETSWCSRALTVELLQRYLNDGGAELRLLRGRQG